MIAGPTSRSGFLALATTLMLGACAVSTPAPTRVAAAERPPGTQPGDPARGRAIAADRQQGMCLLCHPAPVPPAHLQGNLAPDLAGVGRRLSVAEMRRKLLDPRRDAPDSIMPAYGAPPASSAAPARVAGPWRDRPLLEPQQIEDVLAWLASLR